MSRIITKKRLTLGVVTSLLAAALALAYWTTTGDGDGTGSVGAGEAEAIELSGTIDDTLVPGHTSAVTIKAKNTDDETDYHVTSTTLDSITTTVTGCDPAWFVVTDATVMQNETIEANSTGDAEETLTSHEITFVNNADDQDLCKGATVNFDLSSN